MTQSKNVTLFNRVTDTKNPRIIPIEEAFERIRTGKETKEVVTKVYKGDVEAKNELPAVCFSGEFKYRSINGLEKANGLAILDFDSTKYEEEPYKAATQLKKDLSEDNYIFAAWLSPSLGGIKALVKIPEVNDDSEYKQYYEALLVAYPTADSQTKDISRVSYESYDPNIYINESAKQWNIKHIEKSEENKLLEISLSMIRGAVQGERHNTLLRAARLAGGYVAGGYIDEEEAFKSMQEIAIERGFDNPIEKTIRDGINYGKSNPLEVNDSVKRSFKIDKIQDLSDNTILKFIVKKGYGWSKIDDFHEGRVELGVKTGIDFFDKHFMWKKNELYLLTAPKGRGKTLVTSALQVLAEICADWTWIISAQENKVEDYKENLFKYYTHRDTKELKAQDLVLYKKIQDYIDRKYIFLTGIDTVEEALVTTKFIVNRNKNKSYALFLDPINSFMAGFGYSGQVEYSNGHEIAKKVLDFSLKYCTVFVTSHTIIKKQREGMILSESVFGEGGWWLNKASFTMGLNREQGTNDNVLNIDNVRNRKTGGSETFKSNPIVISWKGYDIDISMKENESDVRYDVIGMLQEKFNKVLV